MSYMVSNPFYHLLQAKSVPPVPRCHPACLALRPNYPIILSLITAGPDYANRMPNSERKHSLTHTHTHTSITPPHFPNGTTSIDRSHSHSHATNSEANVVLGKNSGTGSTHTRKKGNQFQEPRRAKETKVAAKKKRIVTCPVRIGVVMA